MPAAPGRPQLIFTTELDGAALLTLLYADGVLDLLAANGFSVALCLPELDNTRAQAARLLRARGIELVAWLTSPPEEGLAFNAQNYPTAEGRYIAFREWAARHGLTFEAVGLEIAPPAELLQRRQLRPRSLVSRVAQSRDTALHLAASAAYTELIATMHHDGYEVHTYQLPLVADDRRARTTMLQRALDIVDLPSDLDVLLCSSSVPIERLGGDLGGALIASYGPAADAIGVGDVGGPDEDDFPHLPWPALRRDLLLAAQWTDTIYVDSLEDCAGRGLLGPISSLEWGERATANFGKRVLLGILRASMFSALVAGRFGPRALAWAGWVIAAVLWLRGRRARRA